MDGLKLWPAYPCSNTTESGIIFIDCLSPMIYWFFDCDKANSLKKLVSFALFLFFRDINPG